MKRLKTLLLAGALLAAPVAAEAKTMALLVGVADYNEASGIKDLLGPRNDVSILWRALKDRGVADGDIAVLTDGLPKDENFPVAKGLAESTNILRELDRLAETAQRGDTIFVYYSGHGTLQPDNPAEPEDEPEADGMDQVLLPSDVGAYDPINMTLKNSIIDDVLGRKIAAIRAKGAFVWAVIDACHSGTVTRGDTVTRSVDPASLGIPSAAPQASRGGTREGTLKAKHSAGEGGLVGFYAVESYDEAIERSFAGYNMPMIGDNEDTQRMGVFTYLLHRALTRNTAQTFRDLAQEIMAELNMDHTGGKVPPPVFDGDLDAPVPGSTAEMLPNSANGILADGKLTLPVGALQGYDVGATLALYAPGKFDEPVAHAEVTGATAVTATAENLSWAEGATAFDRGTLAAVVDTPAISFRFLVSPPPAADFADEASKGLVSQALSDSFKYGAESIGIEMGKPGNPDADVLLRVKDGRLWVVRPDRPWVTAPGAYDETPSLPLSGDQATLATSVKTAVWSLARATKLVRVASALDSAGTSDGDILVQAAMQPSAAPDSKAACNMSTKPDMAQASPVSPLIPAGAGNCDYVSIEVSNDSDIDYYVAGFYVDALGGVSAMPASSAKSGCVRSLPAGTGRKLTFSFWIDTWDEKSAKPSTVGAENFVVLAVPKDSKGGSAPRLCSLTQPTLAGMQQTRDVEMPGQRGSKQKLSMLLNGVQGATT
ncbi:caspase family protein, partial [Aestuariivirga sp.]|uniref:caspase family protein n=1 Tax=Aestuariivirga sp. TaxID=2650926 RepID=UPI00359444C8